MTSAVADAVLTVITDYTDRPGDSSNDPHHPGVYPTQRTNLESLASQKDEIDKNVVVPILESEDIFATFADKIGQYEDWRGAWVAAIAEEGKSRGVSLETVMEEQDARDSHLKCLIATSRERLDESVIKALVGAIDLMGTVRNSAMPYSSEWPEESWDRIAHLLASSELCIIGILHHLDVGIGREDNVRVLAEWSFMYTRNAYDEAGYFGPQASNLKETG